MIKFKTSKLYVPANTSAVRLSFTPYSTPDIGFLSRLFSSSDLSRAKNKCRGLESFCAKCGGIPPLQIGKDIAQKSRCKTVIEDFVRSESVLMVIPG